MHNLLKILSWIILLLGAVHIRFAFPLHPNADTLWFTGSGMAIVFAGLLNLVALDRGGSFFTKSLALAANACLGALFGFALVILHEPQVYVGLALFVLTTVSFIIELAAKPRKPGN